MGYGKVIFMGPSFARVYVSLKVRVLPRGSSPEFRSGNGRSRYVEDTGGEMVTAKL